MSKKQLTALLLALLCPVLLGATIIGGEGNDDLTGTENDDTINARGGDDIVHGLGGSDTIDPGTGNDTVYGGDGGDIVLFDGTGLKIVYGEDGDDTLRGTEVHGGPGNDRIIGVDVNGGPGDDRLAVSGGIALGEDGDDYVTGGGTKIDGGDGNDFINAYAGTAAVDGGPGNDIVEYAFQDTSLLLNLDGNLGFDVLRLRFGASPWVDNVFLIDGSKVRNFETLEISGAEGSRYWSKLKGTFNADGPYIDFVYILAGELRLDASELTGSGLNFAYRNDDNWSPGAFPLHVSGSNQADNFVMFSGDDTVRGNSGDDRIDGGDGVDTAIFSGAALNYTITELAYNTFVVRDDIGLEGSDTIIDVNKLEFVDQTKDVIIAGLTIVGDDTAEQFTGGLRSDSISGAGGADQLSGGGGNDVLSGGSEDDSLKGDAGADHLFGGTGVDFIVGGNGHDVINAGIENDTIYGGLGIDTLSYEGAPARVNVQLSLLGAQNTGGGGVDTIRGVENVIGTDFYDRILGNEGPNILSGRNGNDYLDGMSGFDIASYEGAGSRVFVNLGLSVYQSTRGGGTDRLLNFEGVIGTAFNDVLTGNSLDNSLTGGSGNDILRGGFGADWLYGGFGVDVLDGGSGDGASDVFVYVVPSETPTAAGWDRILNFLRGTDKIDLSAMDADRLAAGNQEFAFAGTVPTAKSIWYATQSTDTLLKGDVTGDATADFVIRLVGVNGLAATDIVP